MAYLIPGFQSAFEEKPCAVIIITNLAPLIDRLGSAASVPLREGYPPLDSLLAFGFACEAKCR